MSWSKCKLKWQRCRKNFSREHFKEPTRTVVFAASLTIAVLGFSIFGSIYSSTVSHAETAYINMYSYSLQSDRLSGQERDVYREIAKEWLKSATFSENKMASRAYSTKWCFLSFVALGVTFVLLFKKGKCWFIPLFASYSLLIFSVLTFLNYNCMKPTYTYLANVYPPMETDLNKDKDWPEIGQVIDNLTEVTNND
jgi:hypothetical protein